MAWKTDKPKGISSSICVATETGVVLPGSATTEYSSVIDFVEPNFEKAERKVSFGFNASAVSGTNLDIGLYGAASPTGTKTLLLDAVVTDITATGLVRGIVDLNDYPSAYYFLGWTSDADESANTIDLEIQFNTPN